ncbi:hypothetical protein [Streptomyces mirabilis]|uniref:hypothetical protein n=1 Tax=Streptomyces mirabilis TaxID=68239 RepID=UPI0036CB7ABD
MGNDDRRQGSAGNNGIVISGGSAQGNSFAVGASAHMVARPNSFRSGAIEPLAVIIHHLTQMVGRHHTD